MSNSFIFTSGVRLWQSGLLICALVLSGCGGGGGDSTPAEPTLANVIGPGHFNDAIKLRSISKAEFAATMHDGTTVFTADPVYDVQTYRLSYVTVDGQGQQIFASALAAIPQKSSNVPSPVLSYQHGTITLDADAPSNLTDAGNPAVVLASQGYIVVAADYVGYGLSKGAAHPYLLSAPSAAAVIDLLTAAKYWRQTQHVPDNKQLFLAGYSEGGYVTLAAQRALQSGISPHRSQVVRVAAGAGPYDVGLTLDEALKLARQTYPLRAALLNPGFLKYLSEADRNNVRDLLMRQLIGADSDVVFMSTVIDNYLADDRASIEGRSDVYKWRPEVPLYLFQGRDDRSVSYLNATTTMQTMQTLGAGNLVSLTKCSTQPAGHLECVPPYWHFLLETFAQVAKDL